MILTVLLFLNVGFFVNSSGQSGCLMAHFRFSVSVSFSSSRRLSTMKTPSNSSCVLTAAPSWFQLMLAAVFTLLTLHVATSVPFWKSSQASNTGGPEHRSWKRHIGNSEKWGSSAFVWTLNIPTVNFIGASCYFRGPTEVYLYWLYVSMTILSRPWLEFPLSVRTSLPILTSDPQKTISPNNLIDRNQSHFNLLRRSPTHF